jgi:hypothetical protein
MKSNKDGVDLEVVSLQEAQRGRRRCEGCNSPDSRWYRRIVGDLLGKPETLDSRGNEVDEKSSAPAHITLCTILFTFSRLKGKAARHWHRPRCPQSITD